MSSRVWLVTGSSSGFGLSICKLALERGDRVVATLRKPCDIVDLASKYSPDALLVLKLDVTHPEDIDAAFTRAKAHFGRVDVVFNNAGYCITGEVEGVPDADARQLMEVNFWGALNVSKAAVRFFREENPAGAGGLLFNMSSNSGHAGSPSMGYYGAAKHALEGLSEALAAEIDPKWNIKVCILAPGFFRTPITAKSPTHPVHPAYESAPGVQRIRGLLAKLEDPARPLAIGDVDKACKAIYEVSMLESPPLRLFLGMDCIDRVRAKYKRVIGDLDRSVEWSEHLQEDPLL